MVSDLYPTKTRVALLEHVETGRVFRDVIGDDYISADRKVNARIVEVERAGWVQLDKTDTWRLTDAGRAVLDQHRAGTP